MSNRWGKKWKQWQTSFSWAPKSLLTMTAAMKLKDACSLESYDKPRQHIKKQRHHFVNEGLYGQSYGFSSSHIWVWELDHKEDWVQKNWYFPIVALEKTVESPLACREIEPVNPKGNQPWIVIGRTVAKAEAPILGQLMQRAHSLEKKTLSLGKIEGKRRGGQQRLRWLDNVTHSVDLNLSKLGEIVAFRGAWRATVLWVVNSRTQHSDWTTTKTKAGTCQALTIT